MSASDDPRLTTAGTAPAAPPAAAAAAAADGPVQLGRRTVVRFLGLAPLAAVLGVGAGDVERVARAMHGLAGAGYAPAFFAPDEWALVRVLADYVIPRDERSGSATDALVPEFIDFVYTDDVLSSPSSRASLKAGLRWLDDACRAQSGRGFVASTDAERRRVLDRIAWPERASDADAEGVRFFNRFRDLTAAGFFSSAMGWKDLQYMGHTFVPEWQGCPQAALDKLGVSYDVMNARVPVRDRSGDGE